MAYLDLDEVADLLGPKRLISNRRFAASSFHPSDHFTGTERTEDDLPSTIRTIIAHVTGKPHVGPIRLLTQLRHFGFYFSPLNMYYGFSSGVDELQTLVAEVSNTPWNERHHYVLHAGNQVSQDSQAHYRHSKAFHVSPFMDMDSIYDWRVNSPGDSLDLSIRCERDSKVFFHAGMTLHRQELTPATLRRLQIRHPLIPLKILTSIYWQAFRLWMKKCPFYPHPSQTTNPRAAKSA